MVRQTFFLKNHKTQKYTKDKKSRNCKINGNHKQVAKTGQLTNNKKVPQNLGQQVLYTHKYRKGV